MTSIPESVASSVTSTASNQFGKVDRKRRDNINDRIQQLLTMIPAEFFQDYYKNHSGIDSENMVDTPGSVSTPKLSSAAAAAAAAKAKSTGTRDGKPNKGQILTQAVEYITYLQSQVDVRNREEVELILKVQELSSLTGTIVNSINLENTSAEVALSKIGVGPLAGDVMGERDQDEESQPLQQQPQPHISSFEYGGYSEYGEDN